MPLITDNDKSIVFHAVLLVNKILKKPGTGFPSIISLIKLFVVDSLSLKGFTKSIVDFYYIFFIIFAEKS